MPMYDWKCDTCGKVITKRLQFSDMLIFAHNCVDKSCHGIMKRQFPIGTTFKIWEDKNDKAG